MNTLKLVGYVPGAIGRITELHATYYSVNWNFGLYFESKVATELSEFLSRFDEAHDGFWAARVDDRIVGSVVIDGKEAPTHGARLRWFIVAPEYQGRGLGNLLIREAIVFCRKANFRRIYLSTFAGLDPARHLYEKFGFVLREEKEDNHWGEKVAEQTFELTL
jgi:ribosomal protein S18 acetylase RimI-like enzyme